MSDCVLIRTWATMDAYELPSIGRQTLLFGIREAVAELERLQAIVDRLPKTADGVPMALGQTVFTLRSDGVIRGRQVIEITDDWIGVQVGALVGTRGSARPEIIYSTREAAEKARAT